jgi:hypothetical protein
LGTSNTKGYNTSEYLKVLMFSANFGQITSAYERSARVSLASVEASFFVTGAHVLFSINQNILGLIPINASLIGQNWDIDFVKNALITGKSCITPSRNGAVFLVRAVIWRREVVWETDWPHELVESNVLGSLEQADIVNDLAGADAVAVVARDAFQKVGLLVFRLVDFVVCSDDNFVGGWRFVPSNEAMRGSQDIPVVDDGTITELSISAKTFV